MINWYFMVAVAVAFALFLVYKEYARKRKSFLIGRLIASLLAVISLLFMAYPFKDDDNTGAGKIVLLTNGFVKDSIDLFLKNNKAAAIYTETSEHDYEGKSVQLIGDWHSFITKHAADSLHVFGSGLSYEALSLLNNHSIIFHATAESAGINDIYWKQHLEAGEQLLLQGSYENTGSKKVKIILQAFGTDKDAVSIAAGERRDFELRTIPVHSGEAVYSLITVAENDTLQKEPVPVEVKPATPLQLLIISSSPDFDNTYLKNHLSQEGYQVTITTTISSNKTDKQFLNMPSQQSANTLTSTYLSKFDVLMTDQGALQKVSAAEVAAIRSAVSDKGTGLIIKMDAEDKQAFYSRFFPVKVLEKDKQSLIQLRSGLADSSNYKLKVNNPVSIAYTAGTQIILRDAASNIYAAGALYGSGKIIATTLQNTYSIALAGKKTSYQQLWWLLLNKAAKNAANVNTWQTTAFIPKMDQPVHMQIELPEGNPDHAAIDKTIIYLKQDKLLPFNWKATYWPVAAGWQQSPRIIDASPNWYVYKNTDWQQLVNNRNRTATEKYAAAHSIAARDGTPVLQQQPANARLYLLIIFLAACIFLWVEQKIG